MMKKRLFGKCICVLVMAASIAFSAMGAGCSGLFGNKNKIDTPALERIGNIFRWEKVKGANKYRISTGGKHTYIEQTAIRIPNLDDGGKLTVTAVFEQNGIVEKKSKPAVIECDAIKKGGTNYKEYDVSKDGDVSIPSFIDKAVFKGDGALWHCTVTVEERNKPIFIELYDTKIYGKAFGVQNLNTEACVILRSLGEDGNKICGEDGTRGADGEDGAGFAGTGGKGGHGTSGTDATKFGYVVFEGNRALEIAGGDGGSGGRGGKPAWYNSVGGDGGNGGNGGHGLVATCAYDFLEGVQLECSGGTRGYGGSGGYGSFLGNDDSGNNGKDGVSGQSIVGEKSLQDFLVFEIKPTDEYTEEEPSKKPDGDTPVENSIAGVYKLYEYRDGEKTYGIGDETPDGKILTQDYMVLTIYADGTFSIVPFAGNGMNGQWEQGGDLIVFTASDNSVTKGNYNDNKIMLTLFDQTVITFKKAS